MALIGLLACALFLVWAAIKRSARAFAAASRNANEGIIVLFVLAVMVLAGFVINFFFPTLVHYLRSKGPEGPAPNSPLSPRARRLTWALHDRTPMPLRAETEATAPTALNSAARLGCAGVRVGDALASEGRKTRLLRRQTPKQ